MGPDDKGHSAPPPEIPPRVQQVVDAVRRAGGAVYLVGGAVRDRLLGRHPTDWDLATSLRPDRLAALFPEGDHRDLRLGVVLLDDGERVSITSYREETDYRDHRHPRVVRFVDDPRRDALRRDFTVNAIYQDPDSGELLDPCRGVEDVRARVLRAIGAADRRCSEDPLRMLRAVRFAAACGLEIEPELRATLRRRAPLLRELSAERVLDELTRAFSGEGRGRALRLLVDLGLAAEVLPEVVPMDGVPQPPEFHPEGDVLTHVCLVLDRVRPGDPVQAWAAVLHDVGKPATFERAEDRIRFSGHDRLSERMARSALQRLRAPRRLIDTVAEVCRDHIRFASLPEMGPGKRERWMRSPNFAHHLEFHRADCAGSHGDLRLYDEISALLRELPPEPPPPLCRGADVVALGVPEGPAVGAVLRELQEELDRLEAPTRETALDLLGTIVRARVKERTDPGR